jgi:polyisoprenoid-binding protein YceI
MRSQDQSSRYRYAAALLTAALMLVPSNNVRAGAREAIDTEHSTVTVRVGKSGVFRAFADDHEIRGTVKQGVVDPDAHTVDILIEARGLRVLDPAMSPEHRSEVQARMLGTDVLDVTRFPEIRFTSDQAEATNAGWTVRGELQLHGQTHPVTATVRRQGNHYLGSVRLKQTEFGITPITVAGGTVKVKDEVTIDFDIATRTGLSTNN